MSEDQETLSRQIYGRLFTGTYSDIGYTVPSKLIGSVFDASYMPPLLLERGKSVYYDFSLAQNTSETLPLPPDYSSSNRLYIAVRTDLRSYVTITSPTHGSTKKTLLEATDDTTDGTHAAFWTYQGDMTTFVVGVPATAQGGATTNVKVFMYEIPDLEDFESYFDKQIGLGTSGDD